MTADAAAERTAAGRRTGGRTAWLTRGGRTIAALGLAALLATACTPGDYGAGTGAGGGGGAGSGGGTVPDPAATPELGSLVLFGSGALGAAGYAMAQLRTRRRPRA